MDYQISDVGTACEVSLRGRLTFDGNETFRDVVALVKERPDRSIVIDMSGLEFIDSAGLGMLLLLREVAQEVGAQLALKGAVGQVQRLLAVSRFDNLVTILA